ncbi:exo-alpha-sialidase [candidate division WOR-3 bacterium]|uniref:Exo-alpha-sialidase n=1 Tax=candidate division WOR-3 bacterium TaxID=2052148 RepID=A0A937XFE0_UNCW3|nr:exo-alpha-sialidase [candidate division WOR-3 bacterium]
MREYNSGDHRLSIVAALREWATSWVQVYEFQDIWDGTGQTAYPRRDGYSVSSPCIAAGPYYKQVAACQTVSPAKTWCAADVLGDDDNDWQYFNHLTPDGKYTDPPEVAIDGQYYSGYDWVYVAHRAEGDNDPSWLYCSRSTNGGYSFYDMTTIESSGEPVCPSLGVNGSGTVYCSFQDQDDDFDDVWFKKSTNNGGNWSDGVNLTPGIYQEGWSPCLAASGSMVFVCWNDDLLSKPLAKVKYRWSSDGGSTWNPDPTTNPPEEPEVIEVWSSVSHTNLNAVMIPGGTWGPSKPFWHVLLVAKGGDYVNSNIATFTVLKRGVLTASGIEVWDRDLGLSPVCFFGSFADYFPSVCGVSDSYDTLAACVWSDPGRSIYVAKGKWEHWSDVQPYPVHADGIGRRLAITPDGIPFYVAPRPPYVITGPVFGSYTVPLLADCGYQPALAMDGDTARWIAYTRDDTVWCVAGEDGHKAVFAGSSSAVPGQPSIVCYPNQANGVYVGSVVFPVYDTAGAASKIMYARVDTGGVVLDTIESVANLGDSLPCVSVYQSDTLVVTWQHGDSTLASMLCDYGPGTSGQVPAWSSPNLVAANGYHAMSRFDDNGTVLNVVWTRKNGSNYAIQRATCDLSTSLFGNWSQMVYFGDTILNFLDLESARP